MELLSRCDRKIVRGRRVVFLWCPARRWGDDTALIEGVEFASEAAAAAFDLETPHRWHPSLSTWDEAAAWVEAEPGPIAELEGSEARLLLEERMARVRERWMDGGLIDFDEWMRAIEIAVRG